MRDLDLIVSVTTVANDPIWLEECRGHPGLDRYWEAVMRRILVRTVILADDEQLASRKLLRQIRG